MDRVLNKESLRVLLLLALAIICGFLVVQCSSLPGIAAYLPYLVVAAAILVFAIFLRLETWGLVLLILAICLSPRFAVGELVHGRTIDIRVEDILIVVLLLAWLLRAKAKPFEKTPIFYPILAYLGISLLSTLLGLLWGWIDPAESFFYLLKEVEYFLIFLLVANSITNRSQLKLLIGTFVILGVADFALKMWEVGGGSSSFVSWVYGPSTFFEAGPMQSAVLPLCVLGIAIGLWAYQNGLSKRLWLTILILMGVVALVLPGSRSFWIGFLGGSLLAYFLLAERKAVVLPLMLLPVIAYLVLHHFYPNLAILERQTELTTGMGSLQQVRVPIWIDSLKEFFLSSPLLGMGKATFPTASGAHNFYIQLLCEVGVIGFLAFMFLWGWLGKNVYQFFRSDSDTFYKGIALAWLVITAGIAVANLFGEFLYTVRIAELYWVISGITVGTIALAEQRESNTGSDGVL